MPFYFMFCLLTKKVTSKIRINNLPSFKRKNEMKDVTYIYVYKIYIKISFVMKNLKTIHG